MDAPMSDFEHVRKRPSMYIGDTTTRGLHHLIAELIDNSIDQFLAGKASFVKVETDGGMATVSDDGVGLPFDVEHEADGTLVEHYLTKFRRTTPTADGHTPHVHIHGYGCGLFIVGALSSELMIQSWRNGKLWQVRMSRGVMQGPPKVVEEGDGKGTKFQLVADSEIFSDNQWNSGWLRKKLSEVASLFPGFSIETNGDVFLDSRGLADWCDRLAIEKGEATDKPSFWMHEQFGDFHIQAAASGTLTDPGGETEYKVFANGNSCHEGGTHLTALKQTLADVGWKPSVAMLHLILDSPEFAGPTRGMLGMDEMLTPICDAIRPKFEEYLS